MAKSTIGVNPRGAVDILTSYVPLSKAGTRTLPSFAPSASASDAEAAGPDGADVEDPSSMTNNSPVVGNICFIE